MLKIKKQKKAFFVLLFFLATSSLFARGKKDIEDVPAEHPEFKLCITAFDVSALPPGLQVLGPILQRELVTDLSRIHYRLRDDAEVERYEEMAWIEGVNKAASEIAKKREERDLLLYNGIPGWKYRQELRKTNKSIKELEEAYVKAWGNLLLIEGRPVFKLLASNMGTPGTFPPPPKAGDEAAFLRSNSVDAFLAGSFRLFYGRLFIEFNIHTRGEFFTYEDSVLFSAEDLNEAVDEIKQRFMLAMINSDLVYIALQTEPQDAQIEANNKFVKSGDTIIMPPGPIDIRVSADDYHAETRELDSDGGTYQVYIALTPLVKGKLEVKFPGPNSSVYLGSMYMGGNPVVEEESNEEEPDKDETEADLEEETEDRESDIEDGETAITEEDGYDETLVAEEHEDKDDEAIEETNLVEIDEEEKDLNKESDALLAEDQVEEDLETAIAKDDEEELEDETEITKMEDEEGETITEDLEDKEDILAMEETDTREGYFSVDVPMGQYQYLRVQTEDGLVGEAIVKGGTDPNKTRIITLNPRKLPGKDDKPVEKARKKFYGAYGRFWIALPLAFVLNGVSKSYSEGYEYKPNQDMYNMANTMSYVSLGAWATAGLFLGETLVRMFIYVRTATKESIPYVE